MTAIIQSRIDGARAARLARLRVGAPTTRSAPVRKSRVVGPILARSSRA